MGKRLSQERFIQMCRQIHGDRYDYTLTQFQTVKDKVVIVCPDHGAFTQAAHSHLAGAGCRLCAIDRIRMDAPTFVRRAQQIHGDRYRYDEADYKNIDTKVKIVCPEHGPFLQTPYNHLRGQRCPECAGVGRYTWEKFLRKARARHGNKYSYTEVPRLTAFTTIPITCPAHGTFLQTVDSHTNQGTGCPVCAGNKKWTLDDFLLRADEIHQGFYDYSLVTSLERGANQTVTVACFIHGPFRIKANLHASGKGCRKCAQEALRLSVRAGGVAESQSTEGQRLDLQVGRVLKSKGRAAERFVDQATRLHGGTYSYEKVSFVNMGVKVEIICPIHGSFWQAPKIHLRGVACYECGRLKAAQSRTVTTEEFIAHARKVHGDRFDYSPTVCKGMREMVTVRCRKHGDFVQTADSHLHGAGCRLCALESLTGRYSFRLIGKEPGLAQARASIYVMEFASREESFLKVGITQRDRGHRYRRTEGGYQVKCLATWSMSLREALLLEQSALKHLADSRYIPRRPFGGHSECLQLAALARLLAHIGNGAALANRT